MKSVLDDYGEISMRQKELYPTSSQQQKSSSRYLELDVEYVLHRPLIQRPGVTILNATEYLSVHKETGQVFILNKIDNKWYLAVPKRGD